MPEAEVLRLGQLAVESGLITREQLAEAVREQERRRASGSPLQFGEMLVSLEYISRKQLHRLLSVQGRADSRQQPIAGYRLLKKIGEGGMGATYLARQASTNSLVALKVLKRDLANAPDFITRFKREAHLAGRLAHPNIVRTTAVGESAGLHYMVMEYVKGRNAYRLIPRGGGMREDLALRIVRQVARALEYAHTQGIVHRDIKPDNILVDARGVAKLCDFGLARNAAWDTRLTQTGTMMGTAHYVSPEQASGAKDLDIRSDIYSLGATLYHLVTGRTPFEGPTSAVVMTKHLNENIPWAAEANPNLSADCCRLIENMTIRERSRRYQTPAELLVDIEKVIAATSPAGPRGTSVHRPVGQSAADTKARLADPPVSKVGVAFLLLLVAGGLFATWLVVRDELPDWWAKTPWGGGAPAEITPAAVERLFHGRVVKFSAETLEIELLWDFRSPGQLEDFDVVGDSETDAEGLSLGSSRGDTCSEARILTKANFWGWCRATCSASAPGGQGASAGLALGPPEDLLLAWGADDSPEVLLSRRAASGQLEEIARLSGDALSAGQPLPELAWKEGEVVASFGGRSLTPSARVSWKTTRAGCWSLGRVDFGELRVVGVLSRNWLREALRKSAASPTAPSPPETTTAPDSSSGG